MQIAYLIKQKSYEKIAHVLRRHAITFVPTVLLFLIMLAVPVIFYLMITQIYPALLTGEISLTLLTLLGSVYYLSVNLFFYTKFIDYYLDLWIITNDRIIDIEQLGLFARTTSELDLFRIQDVTTEVKGFFPTFFHYGDVMVKTASSNTDIVFHNVPNPNKIREDLIKLSHEDRRHHYLQPEISVD